MNSSIKEKAGFLKDLGVSEKALELLTGYAKSESLIIEDLKRLETFYKDMPRDISGFPEKFNTYLWTLLGEISIPNSLGENIPKCWPVLLFPFARHEEYMINDYLAAHGFVVEKRESINFNEVLHAGLYGGQAWFESLRYALNTCTDAWGKEAVLIWMAKGPQGSCSIATMARKMQLQLRANMTSYSVKSEELLYPGVIKAFHTPHLGNVDIHSMLLKLEEWKC